MSTRRQSVQRNGGRLGYVYHDVDSEPSDPFSVSIERQISDLEQAVQDQHQEFTTQLATLQYTLCLHEKKQESGTLFAGRRRRVDDAGDYQLD